VRKGESMKENKRNEIYDRFSLSINKSMEGMMKKIVICILTMFILLVFTAMAKAPTNDAKQDSETTNVESLLKPNDLMELETHWVEVSNMAWLQPYGKNRILPWVELLQIEIELTDKQKKNFLDIIDSDEYVFERTDKGYKKIPKDIGVKNLHEDLINSMGAAKYNSFIRWASTFGITIDPPYRKNIVKNYEKEVADLKTWKEFKAKKGILKDEDAKEYKTFENSINNLIDVFKTKTNLSEVNAKKLKELLGKYRIETSKTESQIRYMEYAANKNVRLISEKEIENYFYELFEKYRKAHKEVKENIKQILNTEQQKIFEEVYGWSF